MQGDGNALPLGKQGGLTKKDHWVGTNAINPTQNFLASDQASIPFLPQGLQPSGPYAVVMRVLTSNVDPRTGKEIIKRDKTTGAVIYDHRLKYLRDNLAPGTAVKVYNYINGSSTGEDLESVPAIEKLMGVNVTPVDTDKSASMTRGISVKDFKDYRKEATRLIIAANAAEKAGDTEKARQWREDAMELMRQGAEVIKAGSERANSMTGDPQ